jgi:Domain of unknown function (DUF4440)
MFIFLIAGLLSLAALLATNGSGEIGDAGLLIGILVIACFFVMLVLVQHDQNRLFQKKFGDDLDKKRKSGISFVLQGRYRWALGLALALPLATYLASRGNMPALMPAKSTEAQAELPAAVPVAPAIVAAGPTASMVAVGEKGEVLAAADTPVKIAPIAASGESASASMQETRKKVDAAVQAWARAWAAGDVDQYLAMYSPAFKPANGLTREQWEAVRRLRVQKSRDITVAIEQLSIEIIAPDRARAVFTQNYKAINLKENSRKTLELFQINGLWKISSERAISLAHGNNG